MFRKLKVTAEAELVEAGLATKKMIQWFNDLMQKCDNKLKVKSL